MRCLTCLACLVLIQLGCAHPPLAPAIASSRIETIVPPGVTDDPPEAFTLLPGDVVRLKIDSQDGRELTNLVVDPSGQLHVPFVGDIAVGGLTLAAAEQLIDIELQRFERFARAGLFVDDPAGHRAAIAGEVEKPGIYPVTAAVRVADLLAVAGGVDLVSSGNQWIPAGDLAAARIIRHGVALPISLELAVLGDPRHNTRLRPGDLVYVPPRRRTSISVLGEVKDPRVVDFRPGMRASEALAAAGGPVRGARLGDVRLVRGDLSAPRVFRIDVEAVVGGSGHDVELLDGDVLYVSRERFESTLDLVQRIVPALAVVTAAFTLGVL